jgi:poly(3-hydroxybutyrate) depolymerase
MGCEGKPRRTALGPAFADTVSHGDIEVTFVTIPGGGHAWPGGRAWSSSADRPTAEVKASELILDFFARHPMES